jgi:arabinose-5-phosphate isomerase
MAQAATHRTARSDQPETASDAAFVRDILRCEADAVTAIAQHLTDDAIAAALDLIERKTAAGGTVIVSGMGKSGLVGAKIAATLASLGTPSHTIHPAEAVHGDLGRIRSSDLLLALSFSGETEELITLAQILRRDGVDVIAITGGDGSSALARAATLALALGRIEEASDLALAPTCSTTATMALGDALALALARRRAFTADDFAQRHPGGLLGGKLRPVVDVLRFVVGENLPLVTPDRSVHEALQSTQTLGRRPGALLVVDDAGVLQGIFTDGDLRRLIATHPDALTEPIGTVMTRSPRTLPDSALVRDAQRLLREHQMDEVPVVDAAGKPVGLLDVQDLVAMRIVER